MNSRGSICGPSHLGRSSGDCGPPHLSFADRGLTFVTKADEGVCMRFVEPVTGIDSRRWVHHPGLTVTVADPHGLIAPIESAR